MATRADVMDPLFDSRDGWTLTFDDRLWGQLYDHLFPGDGDEHGAVVLAGISGSRQGPRLLARDVLLARDGTDYVAGTRGYRALDPTFIASAARRARDEGWIYLAAHCHGGRDRVAFSGIDLESHSRGYPSLLQITGRPVGGLVIAPNAIAGDLWFSGGGRSNLASATVLGRQLAVLTPSPTTRTEPATHRIWHDRQARMFGDAGQRQLHGMRIAVVGLGGAGSMAAEMLGRLGVGQLVLIDPDRLESSNISRVVGSTTKDVRRARRGLRRLLTRHDALKVDVSARLVRSSGLPVDVEVHPTNVNHPGAVAALRTCDWIVLAADSQQARHLVNAVVHADLIPATQIGVKIPVDEMSGDVGDIFTVARRVMPSSGCLWCNGLIDPTQLQLEALGDEGARAHAYVGVDAPAPSVISLNGVAVSMAVSDLLLCVTGLQSPGTSMGRGAYMRYLPRSGRFYVDEPRRDLECPHCGDLAYSLRARGDAADLPVPMYTEPGRTRRGLRASLPFVSRERYDS